MSTLTKNETFLKKHGKDIQAHIFSPHKKTHSLYLFLNFSIDPTNKEKTISFLSSLGDKTRFPYITSVEEREVLDQQRSSNEPVFINLSLTADGLEYLNCIGEVWEQIIHHLKSRIEDLSNENILQGQGKRKTVHAMMLLAHEDKSYLDSEFNSIKQLFNVFKISIIKEEEGRVYRKIVFPSQEKGFAVEHFGYADGLSNPWIRERDTVLKNGKPKSINKWNPAAPVSDFIISEPSNDIPCYGSYLVYRKFEQNVKKFKQAMKVFSKRAGYEVEELGSFVFGRTPQGIPVELLNGAAIVEEGEYNNFDYQKNKCPFFAHIRKANPRIHDKIKMIRRGTTFGKRKEVQSNDGGGYELDDTALPNESVGLLFFSFVNDIDNFHNVLNTCRDRTSEVDPILGYMKTTDKMSFHSIKHKATKEKIRYKGMKGLVSLLEGINLYQPSINFFRNLSFTRNNNESV